MSIAVRFIRNADKVILGSDLQIHNAPYEKVLDFCESYIKDKFNLRDRLKFIIGDVLNTLHNRYEHGSWEQVIPDVLDLYNGEQGMATLVNWAAVCARVPVHIRTSLSFTHHTTVAYVDENDCLRFMRYCEAYNDYCHKLSLFGTNKYSLMMFLLEVGKTMSSRELHHFKMRILAGNPQPATPSKTTATSTKTAFFDVLRQTLTFTTNPEISTEIRLQKANETLQSILAQQKGNISQFEQKAI